MRALIYPVIFILHHLWQARRPDLSDPIGSGPTILGHEPNINKRSIIWADFDFVFGTA